MANANIPRGFVPKRHMDGSPYNGQHQLFLIPASDPTATFVGDVVITGGSAGAAGTFVNGVNCEGIQTAIRASSGTTGQTVVGVVVGFYPDVTNLNLRYRVASTNRLAMVCTDTTVIYEAQEDAVTTPLAPADVGLNVAFSLTAGNTSSGVSGEQIVSASKAVTATLPFKLLGLAKREDNAFNTAGAGTDPAKFEVLLNTGLFMPNVAGA